MLLFYLFTDFIDWKLNFVVFEKYLNIFLFILSFRFSCQMLDHESIFWLVLFYSNLKFSFKSGDKVFEGFDFVLFILDEYGVFKITLINLRSCFELLDFDLVVKRFNLSAMSGVEIFESEDFLIFLLELIFVLFDLNKLLFETFIKRRSLIECWFWTRDLVLYLSLK